VSRELPGWIRKPFLLIALVIFILLEGLRIAFFGSGEDDEGGQP
jgi:hypothetical protein